MPTIIPRAEHALSRKNISPNAVKVMYRLKNSGYSAYLVGGGVRDLLLDLQPKDFDIATDAHPEQIKKLFCNCILIGRRFRLAHIRFGREVIEVATFRSSGNDDSHVSEHGMLLRDNAYGTVVDDVWRRDFSINALYYNIADFTIVDYVNGMDDIKNKIVRVLGDPLTRFQEDPVRMVRAIRIAARLGFTIDHAAAAIIKNNAILLKNVSAARLYDELSKWFIGGKSLVTFEMLEKYNLFEALFPYTAESFLSTNGELARSMVVHGFKNTDHRVREDKPLNPAYLYAVLLWYPLQHIVERNKHQKKSILEIFTHAAQKILVAQNEKVILSQRLRAVIMDIWVMQHRLTAKKMRNVNSIFQHQRFRAAYDFLLLREQAGEHVKTAVAYWTSKQRQQEIKKDDN